MDTESVSDHTLVRQVAAGDQTALRELIDRHHGWLLMRLRRRTPDPELAASAAQDTFVALWTNARRYRGDGEVGAWLWGIAIRQLASRVRVRSAPAPVSSQVISALSPSVRSAEDELLLAIEHGDLGTALNNLSPELRQVLQATVIDGLSTREAAHLLNLPAGTVKSRARIARTRLREQLIWMQGTTP